MFRNVIILACVLLALLWFWALKRSATLFVLKVRHGRVSFSRGRIPPRLLSDIAEIVERAGVEWANIEGVARDGGPKLIFKGEMSPGTQQQLRNVVGPFSVAEIRNGKPR